MRAIHATDSPPARLREILASDAGLTVLLASLAAALFVIFPFVPLSGPGRFAVTVILTLILVSGAFSLADLRRLRGLVIALVAVALGTRWACDLVHSTTLLLWSHVSTILFLALTAGGVLTKVIRRGRITSQRIQGAVAVYLMMGLSDPHYPRLRRRHAGELGRPHPRPPPSPGRPALPGDPDRPAGIVADPPRRRGNLMEIPTVRELEVATHG